MDLQPVTLTGPAIRMEPLSENHAPGLLAVATPDLFDYMLVAPREWTLDGFLQYVRDVQAQRNLLPLAAVFRDNGIVAGVSCYLDIRPEHRGLEIGGTWFGHAYQRTHVNPEAKYLMLRHAFEGLGAVRVQLKTDGRNRQSQGAISRLGAVYEGTLRRHIITPSGYIRDTVMYSITDEEWPDIKASLLQRLNVQPEDTA